MKPLLRAEILKLRTTRTFVALVGSALALSVLIVVLQSAIDDNFREETVRTMFSGDFTGLFIVLLGIMGMAGEWRHRTITSTVLAAPDRLRLLAAKTLGYAAVGALVSVFVTVTIMVIGTVILSGRGETMLAVGDLADILWRNALTACYLGAIGVCVGALIRNQVVAIVGMLFFTFVVEVTLLGLVPSIGRFTPVNGVTAALIATDSPDEDLLEIGPALLVMVAWLGLLFTAAATLLRRRDLT
ncbi:MAG: ABC transporter permease [Solirubrobacteraceae bacterium]